MGRRLGDPHIARDHRLIDLVAEMVPDVGGDHFTQVIAFIEHGQHNTLNLKPRIVGLPDPFDGVHKVAQPLERIEFALQRHQHRVGGHQGVEGQQTERRRAVDENEIIVVELARQGGAQSEHAAGQADQFDLGARQVNGSRRDAQAGNGGGNGGVGQGHVIDQNVVGTDLAGVMADPQAGAGIAMGVQVDDQDVLPDRGKRRPQIDRRGCFADAAFLIGDRDNARLGVGLRGGVLELAHARDPSFAEWSRTDRCCCEIAPPSYATFCAPWSIPGRQSCP